MHQAVAGYGSAFIAQGVGFYLAGQLSIVSLVQLLGIQMLILVFSAVFIRLSHPQINARPDNIQPDINTEKSKKPLVELREGLTLFAENRALLHLVLIVFYTGFLAFGVYLVGMPFAKQFYGGGAVLYAILQIIFTLGIISVNLGVRIALRYLKRRVD